MPINNVKKLFFIIALVLLSISCTKKDSRPAEERAVARWEAIINDDWEKAYTFQTPSYRKTYDSQTHRNGFGDALNWISVKFVSAKYPHKHIADLKLKVTATYSEAGNLPLPALVEERWQLIDGTWWFANK